jgi:hypothetical protein
VVGMNGGRRRRIRRNHYVMCGIGELSVPGADMLLVIR